jgi:arginase
VPKTRLAVIGVPSSAGAYAAGQEDAPAALRDAGLLRALADAGIDVRDAGDLPRFRWRPDRHRPRAQNLSQVVETVLRVRDATTRALARDENVLVLGGDCTVGVGTVAGCAGVARSPGVVYLDMHADLNVPSSVVDGALDWMGVAHMLGVRGCEPALRDAGPHTPLLDPSRIVVLGYEESQATPWEREQLARLGMACVGADRLRADPAGAAAEALAQLPVSCDVVAVHADIDVVDFTDAPLSENTGRNVGVPLGAALAALGVLAREGRTRAITLTELNPLHAAAESGLLGVLCAGLAAALAQPPGEADPPSPAVTGGDDQTGG